MPQQTRASWAQLRVGALAIVALAILGYLVFLLSGSHGLFKGKFNLYTFMGDSSDLSDGAPVRLNGIIIGKVNSVRLSGVGDARRVIKIEMEIEDTYMSSIPVDSQAKISAGNLLGTKFINISRGRAEKRRHGGAGRSVSTGRYHARGVAGDHQESRRDHRRGAGGQRDHRQ